MFVSSIFLGGVNDVGLVISPSDQGYVCIMPMYVRPIWPNVTGPLDTSLYLIVTPNEIYLSAILRKSMLYHTVHRYAFVCVFHFHRLPIVANLCLSINARYTLFSKKYFRISLGRDKNKWGGNNT